MTRETSLAAAAAVALLLTPTTVAARDVELAICIDTSGSMEQLIDSARGRIWDIVNTLAQLEPTPRLRVGLLSYGSPQLASAAEGFVTIRSDLTDDLDAVYAALMALTTDGGDEYVGWALNEALVGLTWSADPDALRIVFIAGNESADQGQEFYDFRQAAADAARMGIIVNAVYAGGRDNAAVDLWPEIARHGSGTFQAIDPVAGTVQIATPQDDELLALNAALNQTYVPYGVQGAKGLANQVAQDDNASRLGVQACSSRVVTKGGKLYDNASWDLVDAVAKGTVVLATLPLYDLPAAMRTMTLEQQQAHVAQHSTRRASIQERIQALDATREAYLREQVAAAAASLDAAMRDVLIDQARSKGFLLDGC